MWHYFAKTYLPIYKIQVPHYCRVVTLTTMKYLISWILANLGAVEGDFWKQSNKFSRWGLSSHHNSSMKSLWVAFSSTCFLLSVQQNMQFDYWHIWKYARFSVSLNFKYLKWLLALERLYLRQIDLNSFLWLRGLQFNTIGRVFSKDHKLHDRTSFANLARPYTSRWIGTNFFMKYLSQKACKFSWVWDTAENSDLKHCTDCFSFNSVHKAMRITWSKFAPFSWPIRCQLETWVTHVLPRF